MSQPILYGASISPYVRKVMVAMIEKNIEYKQIPLVPFGVDEAYLKKSPLGKIPCYEDHDIILPDSACIVAYLEKKHSQSRALYPANATQYAECLWLEKYADTKLVEVTSVFFFERAVAKKFFDREPDEEKITTVLNEKLPSVFSYLEEKSPTKDFLFSESLMIADIAIGSMFVNFLYAGETIDTQRWPKLAAYVQRIHETDAFKQCMQEDVLSMGA